MIFLVEYKRSAIFGLIFVEYTQVMDRLFAQQRCNAICDNICFIEPVVSRNMPVHLNNSLPSIAKKLVACLTSDSDVPYCVFYWLSAFVYQVPFYYTCHTLMQCCTPQCTKPIYRVGYAKTNLGGDSQAYFLCCTMQTHDERETIG